MKRLVIFPFSAEDTPVVRYFADLQEEYALAAVVSPKGIGDCDADVGTLTSRPALGITLHHTDWLQSNSDYDALLVSPGEISAPIHTQTPMVMESALKQGKEVLCLARLAEDALTKYQAYENFIYLAENNSAFTAPEPLYAKYQILYKLSMPVIFVGGLTPNADNFEAALGIIAEGRKQGYQAAGVLCSDYGRILGFEKMPAFLTEAGYTEIEKIVLLNFYLYDLEQRLHPDYLVVQMPDGLIPYNRMLHNDFGIHTYEWSMACNPDFFVCCAPCGYLNAAFWDDLNETVQRRLGYQIDAVSISNKAVNDEVTDTILEYRYEHMDYGDLEPVIGTVRQNCEIPVLLTASIEDSQKLFEQIREDVLTENFAESTL